MTPWRCALFVLLAALPVNATLSEGTLLLIRVERLPQPYSYSFQEIIGGRPREHFHFESDKLYGERFLLEYSSQGPVLFLNADDGSIEEVLGKGGQPISVRQTPELRQKLGGERHATLTRLKAAVEKRFSDRIRDWSEWTLLDAIEDLSSVWIAGRKGDRIGFFYFNWETGNSVCFQTQARYPMRFLQFQRESETVFFQHGESLFLMSPLTPPFETISSVEPAEFDFRRFVSVQPGEKGQVFAMHPNRRHATMGIPRTSEDFVQLLESEWQDRCEREGHLRPLPTRFSSVQLANFANKSRRLRFFLQDVPRKVLRPFGLQVQSNQVGFLRGEATISLEELVDVLRAAISCQERLGSVDRKSIPPP